MANMKRWSDAKLAKELAFARAAKDEGHPENLMWLAAVEAEAKRRADAFAANLQKEQADANANR